MVSALPARGMGGYLPRADARGSGQGMAVGAEAPATQHNMADNGETVLQTLLSGVPLD